MCWESLKRSFFLFRPIHFYDLRLILVRTLCGVTWPSFFLFILLIHNPESLFLHFFDHRYHFDARSFFATHKSFSQFFLSLPMFIHDLSQRLRVVTQLGTVSLDLTSLHYTTQTPAYHQRYQLGLHGKKGFLYLDDIFPHKVSFKDFLNFSSTMRHIVFQQCVFNSLDRQKGFFHSFDQTFHFSMFRCTLEEVVGST